MDDILARYSSIHPSSTAENTSCFPVDGNKFPSVVGQTAASTTAALPTAAATALSPSSRFSANEKFQSSKKKSISKSDQQSSIKKNKIDSKLDLPQNDKKLKNALKTKEDSQALSPSVGDKKKKSAFPCGDCPKSYSTKYNLLKHQTQHTGTGPGQ